MQAGKLNKAFFFFFSPKGRVGGRHNSFTVAVKHPNDFYFFFSPLAEPDSAGYGGRKTAQKDLPFSISPGPLQGLNPFAVPI